MISCLSNYIGIRSITGYDQPESGKFVNGLPGITTDILEDISVSDDYTLQLAWADILDRAIQRLEGDINVWASKYFLNYSLVGNNITGQYDDNNSIATSNHYNGWYFDFYSYSKNLNIAFNSVELYTANAVASSIKIFSATTGDLLDEIDFTSVAGQINTIYIAKEYPIWKYPNLFITYDENVIQTIEADDIFAAQYDFLSARRVGTGTAATKTNLVGTPAIGMIINYNLSCSIDNFVCHRRELFKEAFWYLLGVEFCNERLFSDRINRYTLLNRDEATELHDKLNADYEKKINGVLKGLRMNENDECFVCNKAVNYRTMLP